MLLLSFSMDRCSFCNCLLKTFCNTNDFHVERGWRKNQTFSQQSKQLTNSSTNNDFWMPFQFGFYVGKNKKVWNFTGTTAECGFCNRVEGFGKKWKMIVFKEHNLHFLLHKTKTPVFSSSWKRKLFVKCYGQKLIKGRAESTFAGITCSSVQKTAGFHMILAVALSIKIFVL